MAITFKAPIKLIPGGFTPKQIISFVITVTFFIFGIYYWSKNHKKEGFYKGVIALLLIMLYVSFGDDGSFAFGTGKMGVFTSPDSKEE